MGEVRLHLCTRSRLEANHRFGLGMALQSQELFKLDYTAVIAVLLNLT